MKLLGIIPARYASTRFPGKPLAMIGNQSMIERVYRQAKQVLAQVVVATDDDRIESHVRAFGGEVLRTSTAHESGTDRCAEAARLYQANKNTTFDVVINIQGDEPFIDPKQIELLASCFQDSSTQIATLIKQINEPADISNPNNPKVVINKQKQAIYFSRSPIPYIRNHDAAEWIKHHRFFKHIGIYAYRMDVLQTITQLKQSSLEVAESLEQNRWIENGYSIRTEITDHESISIDTPADLEQVLNSDLIKWAFSVTKRLISLMKKTIKTEQKKINYVKT